MDRAKAIRYFEKVVDVCEVFPITGIDVKRKSCELALAALREQEQREQGCEYCDGTEKDLYYQDGACAQMIDLVYISGNRIECDFGCKAWGSFEIKYCPMCGRKLKKGAEG